MPIKCSALLSLFSSGLLSGFSSRFSFELSSRLSSRLPPRFSSGLPSRFSSRTQTGVTLIELIAFIVVLSISVVAIGNIFQFSVVKINDPIIQSRLVSLAQAQLDEILSRRYDENTPIGGIPVCGTNPVCAGFGLDSGEVLTQIETLDDLDDFHNYQDIPQTNYSRQVEVVFAGEDFSVLNTYAKRITVTAIYTQGQSVKLSVYRFNF